MNQDPRRISLTKKNGGKKSRETIPLSIRIQNCIPSIELGSKMNTETLERNGRLSFCSLLKAVLRKVGEPEPKPWSGARVVVKFQL